MSEAANRAKTKWNARHYKQVKVSVATDLAASFQAACAASGLSMAGVLAAYMAEYCGAAAKESTPHAPDLSTKRKRRQVLREIINQLSRVRDAQEQARDNIPEGLQGSHAFESAEESVAAMDEAIDLLEGVY